MPQVPHLLLEQLKIFGTEFEICASDPLGQLPKIANLLVERPTDNYTIQLYQAGFVSRTLHGGFHQALERWNPSKAKGTN
jgi:hypothetical protein